MDKIYNHLDDTTYAKFLFAFLDTPLPPGSGLSEQMEKANQEIIKAAQAETLMRLSRALFE